MYAQIKWRTVSLANAYKLYAVLILLFGFQPAVADPIHWEAVTEYPATAIPGQGLSTFAKAVALETKGDIVITPRFDAPDGLKSIKIVEAVRDGKIAIGDAFAGSLTSVDAIFQLSSLPFLATGEVKARKLYNLAKTAYANAFARNGQRLLYATPWPATGLWSRDPIGDVAAVKGIIVRCYDKVGKSVFAAVGAKSIELPFSETMPKLKDGTISAVLSSGDGGAGRKLWDFLPHFTEIGYAMPLSFATISFAAFDKLSPSVQAIVLKAAATTEDAQWAAIVTRTQDNYAIMRKNGVMIAKASPEISQTLADKANDQIAIWEKSTGTDAANILEAFRRD